MRIRLIQPPLVQPRYRQLTLPVVGAELAAHGLEVETCDENVEALDESDVDVVGLTCHVYNAPRVFEVAARFRKRGIPVIIGGTFPTVAPQLVSPHCDSVVVGELEGQAGRLVRDIQAGSLEPVYRSPSPPSLATSVKPDFTLLHNERYLRFNFPLETSRGCRFACRFCTSQQLFPHPRTRSLDDVLRDLDQHDHGLVELIDVNFLNDPSFFRQVLPLLERAPIPGWMGQTTVADLVADPSLPEALARSRCRCVFVGLESVVAEGLRSIDKGWSKPDQFLEVAERMRRVGVLVQAGIIVGLDTDQPGTLLRTAEFLEEARVQTVSFTWLHYYPGTEPLERARREGRLLTSDLRDYDGTRPVIRPRGMSVAALESELEVMLRRFYGVRSIVKRGLHRGMRRESVQLLHHLSVNAAMRAYYATEGRPGSTSTARPFAERSRVAEGAAKIMADGSSWLLDRLMMR